MNSKEEAHGPVGIWNTSVCKRRKYHSIWVDDLRSKKYNIISAKWVE